MAAAAAAGVESESAAWNGVVEKTIAAPLDKVWDVASDFLAFPNLLTIEPVEGENRVAGCTRKVTNLPGRTDTDSAQWAKQKLVEINPDEHVFSYEFLENNTGVDPGYYSTFQVSIPLLISITLLVITKPCLQHVEIEAWLKHYWCSTPSFDRSWFCTSDMLSEMRFEF